MVGRVMHLRGAIVYCGLVRTMDISFPETKKKKYNPQYKFLVGKTSIPNMVFLDLLRFQLEFVFIIGTQIRLKCACYRGTNQFF